MQSYMMGLLRYANVCMSLVNALAVADVRLSERFVEQIETEFQIAKDTLTDAANP